MNDLISRQAALDLIVASINQFGGRYTTDQLNMWGLFTQLIQELPAAEPELANNSPKVENENGDLISRQAAMDAPEKFIKDCNPEHFAGHQKFIEFMDNAEIGSFGNWQLANGFNLGLTAAEVAIKNLPSAEPDTATCWGCNCPRMSTAEPEIIRCKDCKFYKGLAVCMIHEEKCGGTNYFCAWAERRSDE